MDAFHRLSRFGTTVRERASPVWKSATVHLARGWQWLMPRRRMVFWVVGISIAIALLIGFVIIEGGATWIWGKYHSNREDLTPILTLVAGVAVASVALARHFAQTNADRQRRITESFSKAVEQLGSDKLEVRLGGIYSLERISKESPDDYWTVMENLTAFVRERSRRNEAERTALDFEQRVSRRAYFLWQEAGRPGGRAEEFWAEAVKQDELGERPATDIDAALTVIKRRGERNREREAINAWRLDLSGAILKRCNLRNVHLEGANLGEAHLQRAFLTFAHLEGANFFGAHLEEATFDHAHLEETNFGLAHLEGAFLTSAHLEGAFLRNAYLEGAYLWGAHVDAATKLPAGMAEPAPWPREVYRDLQSLTA